MRTTQIEVHNVASVEIDPDGWLGGDESCPSFRRQHMRIHNPSGHVGVTLYWSNNSNLALPYGYDAASDRVAEQAQTIRELRAEVAEFRRQALARHLGASQ